MTLRVRVHPAPWASAFGRDHVVRLGRGRTNDVRVGHELVQGLWTVSKNHAHIRWDGTRWSTLNVSDKPGLLWVYEPGYEEVPLEPGRPWVPVRHRWSYAIGRPGHRFQVVCQTDDHKGPAVMTGLDPLVAPVSDRVGAAGTVPVARLGPDAGYVEEEPTAGLDGAFALELTTLERDVLLAYYSDFALLPRPATLAPRSHEEAARRLARSKDSTRKAIERVNEKVSRAHDAPVIATGRNVSAEIGRWLARVGVIDPL